MLTWVRSAAGEGRATRNAVALRRRGRRIDSLHEAAAEHHLVAALRYLDGDRLRHRRRHLLHIDHYHPIWDRVVPDRELRAVAIRSNYRPPFQALAPHPLWAT